MATRNRNQWLGMALLVGAICLLLVWKRGPEEVQPEALLLGQAEVLDTQASADGGETLSAVPSAGATRREEAGAIAAPSEKTAAQGYVTVQGLVQGDDGSGDLQPVEGAAVVLKVNGKSSLHGPTDADGRFVAQVQAPSRRSTEVIGGFRAVGFAQGWARARISRSKPTELTVVLKQQSWLYGQVEDADGEPVERCDVLWLVDGEVQEKTTTNRSGAFVFEFDDGGEGQVMARKNAHGISPALGIRLAKHGVRELAPLVLGRGGALRGRVVDQEGNPMQHARVQFTSRRWILAHGHEFESYTPKSVSAGSGTEDLAHELGGLALASTHCNEDGSFEALGMEPGVFRVLVREGAQKAVFTITTDARAVDLILQRHTLTVYVSDKDGEPISGVTVRLSPTGTFSDEDRASFRSRGVPPLEQVWLVRDGSAPFVVVPNIEYRLSVCRVGWGRGATTLHVTTVTPLETQVWIGIKDTAKRVDLVLDQSKRSGSLFITLPWPAERHYSEKLHLIIGSADGNTVVRTQLDPKRPFAVALFPGSYTARIDASRNTDMGRLATEFAVRFAARDRDERGQASWVSEELKGRGWGRTTWQALQVLEDQATEISLAQEYGGRVLILVQAEAHAPQALSSEVAPPSRRDRVPGILISPKGTQSENHGMLRVEDHLRIEEPTKTPDAYLSTLPLEPGNWSWRANIEGFEPIDIDFEIRARRITTVVGILKPAR